GRGRRCSGADSAVPPGLGDRRQHLGLAPGALRALLLRRPGPPERGEVHGLRYAAVQAAGAPVPRRHPSLPAQHSGLRTQDSGLGGRLDFRLTEEQQAMRALVREVAEREFKPRAQEWERSGEFPWPNVKLLGELGILGLSIPEEYGGAGGTWVDAAIALEEIGRCCYVT